MSEFPRPCKNCGNPVTMHKEKLVHVYRKSQRCRMFPNISIDRDSKGMPTRMLFGAPIPIPDPVPKDERFRQDEQRRWNEWQRLYGGQP